MGHSGATPSVQLGPLEPGGVLSLLIGADGSVPPVPPPSPGEAYPGRQSPQSKIGFQFPSASKENLELGPLFPLLCDPDPLPENPEIEPCRPPGAH